MNSKIDNIIEAIEELKIDLHIQQQYKSYEPAELCVMTEMLVKMRDTAMRFKVLEEDR